MAEIQIHRDFSSVPEGVFRTLRIYLPDAYAQNPEQRFGVLYMQDGQNVFAHPESARWDTWGVNDALSGLVAEGAIDPWIVVGIDHGPGRFEEYSLCPERRAGTLGRGEAYLQFVADHLKPHIDRTLRTKPEQRFTGIIGSSLGGLMALSAGMRRHDVFGRIGAMSPSVMWADGFLYRDWKRHTGSWSRIYIDVGETERFMLDEFVMDYGGETPKFYEHLRGLGYGERELKLVIERGGEHGEQDWRRRLPEALRWLLARG